MARRRPGTKASPEKPDAAALAAAVLDEEAKRQTEQEARSRRETDRIADRALPGVGDEAMSMREVIRRGGWPTITVIFAINFVDDFDRIAYAILGPDIQRTLGLSDAILAIGGALGGFLVFVAAIPIGYLADRMRRTTLLGIFSLFWAAFAILTGLVRNTWQLIAARVLTGIGKANEGPVQRSLLADAYPIAGRARVYAVHNAANAAGNAAAPILAGGVAALVGGAAGWRWVFILLSIPAVVFALSAFLLREPGRGQNEQMAVLGGELHQQEGELPISIPAAFARLKKIKTFYSFLIGLGALGFGIVAAPIFINLILEREFGLDAIGRGIVGSIVAGGALAGTLIGGRYGDRLFRQAPEKTVLLIGAAIASFGVTMPISVYMPNVYGYLGVAALSGLFTASAFVPAAAIIAAVTPYRLRAMGFATVGIYLTLVGGVGGALVAGGISDALGPQAAIAITVPIAAFIGGGLIVYGSRFVRQDIALTVGDLLEEHEEAIRVAQGGEVPALQVRNLDFSYGHVQVLFDVNMDVHRGEVLALLGTNGAGKSTLLRAISGLGIADRGTIRLNGRTVTFADPPTRVKLGIVQVPGGKAVFGSLTVRENLVAGAYTFVWDRERVEAKVQEVLDLFPILAERIGQPAGTLSGGEQQMLAIAKALLLEPEVLLIDELSLGLAPVVVQELLGVVEQLKARGITMVIVEQSVNVALTLADRAVFMEKGRIRFEGGATELLERDDLLRAVFLGGEGG